MGHPFRNLKAWQATHRLALAVYTVTKKFPKQEIFGLTSQSRRAAYSAPANIAEGSCKRGSREMRRYLDIALGSLTELEYALIMAHDLTYIDAATYGEIEALRSEAGKLTWGLYQSLGR